MNSVQSQHASGRISAEILDINPQNSAERFVLWLQSDETPLIYKIGAIGLAVISGYAIGALIGYPLLTTAFVTLTFGAITLDALNALRRREQIVHDGRREQIAPAQTELNRQIAEGREQIAPAETERDRLIAQEAALDRLASAERERVTLAVAALNRRHAERIVRQGPAAVYTNMRDALGGEEAFNALPVLNIGNQPEGNGYIDLVPENLPHSVMRGIDRAGRHFISIKAQLAGLEQFRGGPTVLTFIRGAAQDEEWACGSLGTTWHFSENRLTTEDYTGIHRLVVEHNHPTLLLV